MQGLTHFLTGVFVYKYLKGKIKRPYDIVLIIVLSFLSHGVLDSLARATYHPTYAILDDPFWWTFHIAHYSLCIIFVVYFFKECWYALIASDLPDLWDWFVLRPSRDLIVKDTDWAAQFFMHQYIFIIPSVCFEWLPNLNNEPIGIIPEIILDVALFLLIYLKGKKVKLEKIKKDIPRSA